MKKIILPGLLLCAALAVGWFFVQNADTEPIEDSRTTTYINEEYGFTLEIPESWKGKYAVERKEESEIILFHFNYTGDEELVQPLFSIAVYASFAWAELRDGALNMEYLGEANERAFVLIRALDNPYTDPETLEEYGALASDVARVAHSFALNEDLPGVTSCESEVQELARETFVPASEWFRGTPREVSLSPEDEAYEFRTTIREQATMGPNAAGFATLATWGCGSGCQQHALVDARTGEVFAFGLESEFGVRSSMTSEVLITNPPENAPFSLTEDLTDRLARATRRYYRIESGEEPSLKLICEEPASAGYQGYAEGDDQGDTEKTVIETKIDQGASAFGEKVVPLEVLEDSRCPSDAQCVWAGTVRVRTELHSGLGKSEQFFELNKPITTEVNSFELIEVRPESRAGATIPPSRYTFVFEVTRRDI